MSRKLCLVAIGSAAVAGAVMLVVVNFSSGEKEIREQVTHSYAIADPQYLRSISALLGPPVVGGNHVETLLNGDQIFPAMLKAIEGARKTITFETYIYWSGIIGNRFAEALAAKARQGLRVHVLLDWVGSNRIDKNILETMS